MMHKVGGDCPLPEFSQETLEQAREQALAWLEEWSASDASAGKLPLEHLFPSVAFGLSCALAEMKGLLHEEGNYQVAPLCYGDPDELYDPPTKCKVKKSPKLKWGCMKLIAMG